MERRWMLSLLLCIGIVGYFSVPAVANYVIHAHGGNGLLNKVTSIATSTVTTISAAGSAAGGRAAQGAGNILSAPADIAAGYSGSKTGYGTAGAVGRAMGKGGAYLHDKIVGH